MRIQNYLRKGIAALSVLALASCFDDNYDLGNIDTTAKFQTRQLVVPVNIDDITLEQVLDIDDDGEIVKVYDQNRKLIYAIKKSGSFTSNDVIVDDFTIPIPAINPTEFTLELEDLRKIAEYVIAEGTPVAYYEINEHNSIDVGIESNGISIDKAIRQMEHLDVTTKFSLKLKVEGLSREATRNTKLTGLKIQFPKAMHIITDKGSYDQATGILDLSRETIQLDSGGELDMSLEVDGMTCNPENVAADYERHLISFAGNIRIVGGKVEVYVDTSLESSIRLQSSYSLDNIKVHSVTGKVEYALDDLCLDPINIDNMPDILSKEGTDIAIENPQIYISMNNPLHEYDMIFQTDLQLTAMRNQTSKTYTPDDGTFKTQSAKASDNEFLLSPKLPEYFFEGYENPQHVRFTSLKNVLTDMDGVPSMIKLDALNPMMSSPSHASNFRLGENHGPVMGEYTFFAPLQLSKESQIMYTDTIDGWNDEDVDAITIEKLLVAFDASTDVPFDTELTILPIDKAGRIIKGVECSKAVMPAEAEGHHVEMTVNGTITHLDGMVLQARLVNKNNNSTLAPDMKLNVKNCKVTVTGSYTKEL